VLRMWSARRPGVHTSTWGRLLMALACFIMSARGQWGIKLCANETSIRAALAWRTHAADNHLAPHVRRGAKRAELLPDLERQLSAPPSASD
jgi:hypothetical protein